MTKTITLLTLCLLGFNSCQDIPLNFTYNEEVMAEIEAVLTAVIETDPITTQFPDFQIYSIMPIYKTGNPQPDRPPGPDLIGPVEFPDLTAEFKPVQNIKLSERDLDFFELQLSVSKGLNVSLPQYGDKVIVNHNELFKKQDFAYIAFSTPLFSADMDIAWVRTTTACGYLCGEGKSVILQKQNGHWEKVYEHLNWKN